MTLVFNDYFKMVKPEKEVPMTKLRKISSRNQEGFTLIEVVVASSVMMIVFVALIGATSFARRMQSVTENRLACLHLARQAMEPYSSYQYDAPEFATGKKNLPGNRGSYVITKVANENSKDVAVTIDWIEPSGRPYSITLTSSFSRSLHR